MIRMVASWDWITPLISAIQSVRRRPWVQFNIPEMSAGGLCAWEIKLYLKRNGVEVWGMMVIGDDIVFRVREHQVNVVYWLLAQAGVSV